MTAELRARRDDPSPDRGPSAPDLGVGFDTIRLRGPARAALFDHLDELTVRRASRESQATPKSGWSQFRVGLTHVRVNCNRRTGPLEVTMEFSGPKVRRGSNVEALPLCDLDDTIAEVIDGLGQHLPGLGAPGVMRVTRLDLARDFVDIHNPSSVLSRLAARRDTGRYRQETWSRAGSANLMQTLVRRVDDYWRASCYDKLYEQDEVAVRRQTRGRNQGAGLGANPAPRLRWEIQLGHRTTAELRAKHGPRYTGNPVLLSAIAAEYFSRSDFDQPYQGGATMYAELMQELAAGSPKDRREAHTIAIYVASQVTGVELLSHNTIDRARKSLRSRGLSVSDLLTTDGPPARLDFETGRVDLMS